MPRRLCRTGCPGTTSSWTVLDAVAEWISAFYVSYRSNLRRPAYEPSMMVALLLYYACAREPLLAADRARLRPGPRLPRRRRQPRPRSLDDRRRPASPRGRARRLPPAVSPVQQGRARLCRRRRDRQHEGPCQRLARCQQRLRGDRREILAEAARQTSARTRLCGDARGDEDFPSSLRERGPQGGATSRQGQLDEGAGPTESRAPQKAKTPEREDAAVAIELDPARFVTRAEGRRAWLRESRRALGQREREGAAGRALARSASLSQRRGSSRELQAEHGASAAYEAYRARGVMRNGRRL